MICIINSKYIKQFEGLDSFSSYEDEDITPGTLRFIEGFFYKATSSYKLSRFTKPNYGFKGKYQTHWDRLNEREMKKACYGYVGS